jgi:hypothetical protein
MACAVDYVVSKLPQTLDMGFRWEIRSMLQNHKSSMPDMIKKELKDVKSLRLN